MSDACPVLRSDTGNDSEYLLSLASPLLNIGPHHLTTHSIGSLERSELRGFGGLPP